MSAGYLDEARRGCGSRYGSRCKYVTICRNQDSASRGERSVENAWDQDKILRVAMTRQTVAIETFPARWKLLGGRALSVKILFKECESMEI